MTILLIELGLNETEGRPSHTDTLECVSTQEGAHLH